MVGNTGAPPSPPHENHDPFLPTRKHIIQRNRSCPPTQSPKNLSMHLLPATLHPTKIVLQQQHRDKTTHSRTMPLPHVVMYQAFREITNFIRNNGDDCDEFCTNTTRTTQKPTAHASPLNPSSKHKTDKNKGRLAPELLLQANPHRFVLFCHPTR